MKLELIIEMEFSKEPKKLDKIMYAVEKVAFDKAMSGGDSVVSATCRVIKGIETRHVLQSRCSVLGFCQNIQCGDKC